MPSYETLYIKFTLLLQDTNVAYIVVVSVTEVNAKTNPLQLRPLKKNVVNG